MKIILTHEQADFDAMASLLGAHLLDEALIPVLPRKVNRNVRAFLHLYGIDLPFIDLQDLPHSPIESITLVDTQSLISVRGASSHTKVYVIDHHPLREDLPADWNITVSGTGANTTLFIETLRERDVVLSTVQSTLLLLGIYEDTGSLTYSRTTARDLRAASYLLEQGASLQIAADFLNHPLSTDQQAIYDQLRSTAVNYRIHGYMVIVATGDAKRMDEELSSVVHKLRDLLDPDAIFVLIATRGGVQLIARSNSDNIDVAQIAANFGGGGHERAAAGIIKNKPLEEARAELIDIIHRYVQPSITVAEIMSTGPQLVSPETRVEDVANRMQRFGHEGYPVVEDGSVVGLLTRRGVDRAISHQLNNYPASKVMDAGEYSVKPDDSIETLQRLMTDSGWGQIPVVQPDTGEIIGIVTRTDVLKTLTSHRRVPGWQSMVDRLESALPAARLELLKLVARAAHEQGNALYIVGGFVRDLLLDRPSTDFDLVVEGDAIALARSLARVYGGRITSHTRFGTAKWLLRQAAANEGRNYRPADLRALVNSGIVEDLPDSLDLISARTEFYTHPTALPTVERGSIKLDLHRRDFTINTLALRLDGRHYGELHDYWGGLGDLRLGLVRVLHSLSFVDDPTRILRAVRFEQRFGFQIEKRTLELLRDAEGLLERLSGDRIRHELNYILEEQAATGILSRVDELGILKAIHPELVWDEWLHQHLGALLELDLPPAWGSFVDASLPETRLYLSYIMWLIRLPVGFARSVSERLKLPTDMRQMLIQANQLLQELPKLSSLQPSQITDRLDNIVPLAVLAVYLASDQADVQKLLDRYVTKWRLAEPTINGHDLRARAVPPGPVYRQILKTLRDAWLDGKISTAAEENELLTKLLAETAISKENFKVKQ